MSDHSASGSTADGPVRSPLSRYAPAIGFVAGAAIVVAVIVALLSLDSPVTRRHDPRTRNAYVGGDVTGISARVPGYLRRLAVVDNQPVHRGELIAELDSDDYRAELEQAQAALQAARAQLAEVSSQQRQLEAQLGQLRSAETASVAAAQGTSPELARQRALIHTDLGAQRLLDRAEADQSRAVAGIAAARAQLLARQLQFAVLDAQSAAAEASITAREADVALARLNLGWTRIMAPEDGVLGALRVRLGDLLAPGSTLGSVTPLDTVWVDANFTERQLALIRIGQRARLRIDSFPHARLDGRVIGLSPVTGGRLTAIPPDNTTGNFTKVAARVSVRIQILWGDGALRGQLRPGMSAEATVLTGAQD